MMQSALSPFYTQSFPQHRQHCLHSIHHRIRHFLPTKQLHSPSYHPRLRCHYDFPIQPRKPISFPATDRHFLTRKLAIGVRHSTHLLCGNSSNISSASSKSQIRGFLESLSEALSTAFPLWVALGCLMGLWKPNSFNWVTPQLSIWGLTIIMLGMGMTLTFNDLQGAFAMPKEVLAGFCLQYSVMPLSGYFVSKLLGLPSHFAAGLILVGCCPGGTASNIVTYIARGNVALSVVMTAASTFSAVAIALFRLLWDCIMNSIFSRASPYLAIVTVGLLLSACAWTLFKSIASFEQLPSVMQHDALVPLSFVHLMLEWSVLLLFPSLSASSSCKVMTPFLTAKLAGQYIAVDAAGLFKSTLQVVLLPVLAGAFLNQYFQGLVGLVSPLMPPMAVATVAILCGNAIAQSSSAILTSGRQVVLAVCLLHASGFFFGYVLARLLGVDVSSARTISIEVGMQNSVLGVVLANKHFGNPLTAVPCAVSSVCHSIIGSALAGIWRRSSPKEISD